MINITVNGNVGDGLSQGNVEAKASKFYGEQPKGKEEKTPDENQKQESTQPRPKVAGSDTNAAAEQALYGGQNHYKSNIQSSVDRLADKFNLSPEEIEESHKAAAEFFSEHEISPHDAGRLHGYFAHHMANPPSDKQVESWEKEAMAELRSKHGEAARQVRKDIQKYLDSTKYGEALAYSGMDSHPEVIRLIAERVGKLKEAGKLK